MKELGKRNLLAGVGLLAAFAVFTWLVQTVDAKPLGVNGTSIGFSSLNLLIHGLFGVHMTLYTITDWAGLVPVFTALAFAVLGLVQLVKRGSLLKVDTDILILGVHYIAVAACYVIFEELPINYRPVLIDGVMEVSYPSSTTLLVLGVMPTLAEQMERRCASVPVKRLVRLLTIVFSVFMVAGRLLSGVHWLTDIIGSVLVSMGLFCSYRGFVRIFDGREKLWNLERSCRS